PRTPRNDEPPGPHPCLPPVDCRSPARHRSDGPRRPRDRRLDRPTRAQHGPPVAGLCPVALFTLRPALAGPPCCPADPGRLRTASLDTGLAAHGPRKGRTAMILLA